MQLHDVTVPTRTGLAPGNELRGLLAFPDGNGPFPGVVMVHEVFGIEENMRAQAERLCSAGYLVLMPDLYSRGGMRRCLNATFRALTNGEGQAFDDCEAAKQMLIARSDCTGSIGVIGSCMGGGFALQLASPVQDVRSRRFGNDVNTLFDFCCVQHAEIDNHAHASAVTCEWLRGAQDLTVHTRGSGYGASGRTCCKAQQRHGKRASRAESQGRDCGSPQGRV